MVTRRLMFVMCLAALLSALVAGTAPVRADATPTYTPIATRTPRATVTPWVEVTVAASDMYGTPVPVGTFYYSATAGDLIIAFLQIALILALAVVVIWLYRNRA